MLSVFTRLVIIAAAAGVCFTRKGKLYLQSFCLLRSSVDQKCSFALTVFAARAASISADESHFMSHHIHLMQQIKIIRKMCTQLLVYITKVISIRNRRVLNIF